MKLKERLSIILLIIVFIATAGMFVYQNFLSSSQMMKHYQYVLVAKQDLADGAVLTEKNVGIIPIPKDNVLENYIVDADFDKEVKNKVLKGGLLKNEIITTERVTEEYDSEEDFAVIVTSENSLKTNVGEAVNVYVQLTESERFEKAKHTIYEIARNKVVQEIIETDNNKNKLSQNIKLNMSEDESLAYYRAKYLKDYKAEIIVVPYKDVISESEGATNEYVKAEDFRSFLEKYNQKEADEKSND